MFYLVLVIFLLVGSLLTVITIQNLTTPVHMVLFTWQTPDMPLGLLVLGAFILGALLLYAVSALSAMRDQREAQKLRMRVAELEQQVASSGSSAPMQTPVVPPIMQMPGIPGSPRS